MIKSGQAKVAVLGSGIAGLSAAWLLSHKFQVTVFEKSKRLGMGQKGIDVDGHRGKKRIDVPIRVFSTRYYPNLYQICRHLEIPLRFLNNDGSFSNMDGETYFRYRNLVKGDTSISYVTPSISRLPWLSRFLVDYGKLFWDLRDQSYRSKFGQYSLGEYLERRKYSDQFSDGFFIPIFSAIATCTKEQVLAFPACVVLELFKKFSGVKPIRRWAGGTTILEEALAKPVNSIHFDSTIVKVWQESNKVNVMDSEKKIHAFDYAIVALQANQAASILDQSQHSATIDLLNTIPYAQTTMSVHTNPSLMPKSKKDWAAVNYLVNENTPHPMATLWINKSEPEFENESTDFFHTLNPPELLGDELGRARFERPLVNLESHVSARKLMEQQKNDTSRRIFLTGSYLGEKLPLLENGVVSSLAIAKQLEVDIPLRI